MNPLPYVFPYSPIFWAIMVWAFWPEVQILRRAEQSVRRADSPDAGSYRIIVIVMWIAFAAAFPLGWVDGLRFPKNWDIAFFVVGLIFLTGGSLLRRHCWRMLGTSFTGDVQARAGQHIVTSGAYTLLRHPSYTAGILMYTGIGLALGSWASAALLIVSSIAVYIYRMTVEERALLRAVGEPYREFMRTRKRLIPYVY
jgi:protein-S-isoprenylcysteine O-methyltransferase Ste14